MYPEIKSLFVLNPNITYLNHGSYGACPIPVFKSLINWQKQLEYNPVKHLAYDLYDYLDISRAALSDFLNCHKDDIVLSPNPSTALNTVIRSLDLEEGDEILTTNHEYGALNRTWDYYCKKTGAKYIQNKISLPLMSNKAFVEEFSQGITKKTKVIFISHVTSSTALIFPVEKICKLAKENNIICIIDGAHAPGYINLDLKKLNCDVYVGACHKWMCTPKGVSFLYVRKELQDYIEPLVVSWGYKSEYPSHSKFLDYHQWQGTKDMSAYLTIPDAIKFLKDHDWLKVRDTCRKMNLWARDEINNILHKKPICKQKFLGQMSSMYIDCKDPIDFQIELYKKYKIQIPITEWNKKTFIRISIQAYNTKEDVFALLDILKKEFH